jgi:hypothetical protein
MQKKLLTRNCRFKSNTDDLAFVRHWRTRKHTGTVSQLFITYYKKAYDSVEVLHCILSEFCIPTESQADCNLFK